MRTYSILFGILIAVAVLAGPLAAPASAEPVTLEFWVHSGKAEEREVFAKLIDQFNKENADIQVEMIQLPEGSYNEQVNAAALAGDLPDVLDFDGPNVYNYAWSGYLVPLDDFMDADAKADFLPSIIAQGTYAGKIYALGSFDSGLAIWGNKAYLDKAGVRIPTGVDDAWDMTEFMDALNKLKALPEVEYPIDFKMNYGVGEWFTYGFSPILQSFGADLINRADYQSADGVLNGQAAVDAMTWFQTMFSEGYSLAEPAGDDDFYIKKITALTWVGHWMWLSHHDNLGDDLVLIPMPKLGVKSATGMGSWCWGITSNSEHPEAAWEFVKFLTSTDSCLAITNYNGAVPARKSAVALSDLYKADGPLNLFVQQLEAGVAIPRPITPGYPTITSAFAEAVQNIVSGADVKKELDKAVKAIDLDIEDNQGYPTAQ